MSVRIRTLHGFAVYSLLNPVGDDNAKDVQRKFDGDELSTGFVLRSLGGPDRNNGVEYSRTPPIDETGAYHPSVVLSRSLESRSEDSPTSSKSNCLDTAIAVTEPTANETAHEGTEIVDGHNATLEKGVVNDWGACFGIRVTEFHGGVVVVKCTVDTTHHALIISEEEDGETSNTIDSDEEFTLLKFVDHIGPGNDVHDGDYPECLVVVDALLLKYDDKTGALFCYGEAKSGAKSGGGGLKRKKERERERRTAWVKEIAGGWEGFLYVRFDASESSLAGNPTLG